MSSAATGIRKNGEHFHHNAKGCSLLQRQWLPTRRYRRFRTSSEEAHDWSVLRVGPDPLVFQLSLTEEAAVIVQPQDLKGNVDGLCFAS